MRNVKTWPSPHSVAAAFAEQFSGWLAEQSASVNIALSGGSTPKILFQHWADAYADRMDWSKIHFFWGDERCVPPDDSDSNYGVAKELFLDKLLIPESNIHRVHGESKPAEERARYEEEIRSHVPSDSDGLPQFDMIMLGMGDDGHTASIFPHEMEWLESPNVCEVATHPESGQKRITLTGPVLNAAKHVAFLITGANKSDVLAEIVNQQGNFETYPTAHVVASQVDFYLDEAAASRIS